MLEFKNRSVGFLLLRYSVLFTVESLSLLYCMLVVGEPKSRIVQKHTFFAPERYTAEVLYTDSLNSA